MSWEELLNELKEVGLNLVRYEKLYQSTLSFLRSTAQKFGENLTSEEELIDFFSNKTYFKPVVDELRFFACKLDELTNIGHECLLKYEPYSKWLQIVKGVSTSQLIKMLTYIDFNKAKHPSSIWKYARLVDPNILPKEERGKGNRELKRAIFLQGLSFLGHPPHLWLRMVNKPPRLNGGYARLYVKFRTETDKKHPDWVANRRYRDALRKMMKVFTSHLYIVHYYLYHEIVEVHYAVAKLHQNYIYMPVIDKGEKPEWWYSLRDEYLKMKIKPVEI